MAELFIYDENGPSWMGLISAEDVATELRDHEKTHVLIPLSCGLWPESLDGSDGTRWRRL